MGYNKITKEFKEEIIKKEEMKPWNVFYVIIKQNYFFNSRIDPI